MNLTRGMYYYKTYENNQITCIKLFDRDLDTETLYTFELNRKQNMDIR